MMSLIAIPSRCNSVIQPLLSGPSRSMKVGSPAARIAQISRPGSAGMTASVDWTPVIVEPAQAEVAEVAYQRNGSSGGNRYFESVGLTMLQDRMMITVYVFYNDRVAVLGESRGRGSGLRASPTRAYRRGRQTAV